MQVFSNKVLRKLLSRLTNQGKFVTDETMCIRRPSDDDCRLVVTDGLIWMKVGRMINVTNQTYRIFYRGESTHILMPSDD
jgi:hypothetical protein